MSSENQIDSIKRTLKAVQNALNEGDGYAKNDEVIAIFDAMTEAFKSLRKDFEENDSELSKALFLLEDNIKLLESKSCTTEAVNSKINKITDIIESISEKFKSDLSKIESKIPEMPDISSSEKRLEKLVDDRALELKKEIELTKEKPEILRDKLESLRGEERLDRTAIKGLDEEFLRIRGEIRNAKGGVTIFGGSRGREIKYYDLSAQLDGSTKTFSLPAFWRVVDVKSSSQPFTLRPTVDYTIDGSTHQITFTSQIDAASTLSSGQTLIILYTEP